MKDVQLHSSWLVVAHLSHNPFKAYRNTILKRDTPTSQLGLKNAKCRAETLGPHCSLQTICETTIATEAPRLPPSKLPREGIYDF
jgi:hypothetical protein